MIDDIVEVATEVGKSLEGSGSADGSGGSTGPSEKRFLEGAGTFFIEVIKIVVLAGITIGFVRYFIFKPFYVKGQSMEPSFFEHEYLIVDEVKYRFGAPERGEVVVFESPTHEDDFYLKRIIALPGERVKLEDGKVIIYNETHPQGIILDEGYLDDESVGSLTQTVGDRQYFVLGDNRDASYDSRRFGSIDEDAIVGRAVLRGWPFSRFGVLKNPEFNF